MQVNSGLEKNSVDAIIKHLDSVLCDLNVLYYLTLNFHWNMEDHRFVSLHKFLEGQYNELVEYIDAVAERYRKLGRTVPATMKAFLEGAELKECSERPSGDEMLKRLSEAHEHMVKKVRTAITKSDDLNDPGTADMLTAQLRWHEKQAWMLRSNL